VTELEEFGALDFPLQLLIGVVAVLVSSAVGIGSGLRS